MAPSADRLNPWCTMLSIAQRIAGLSPMRRRVKRRGPPPRALGRGPMEGTCCRLSR